MKQNLLKTALLSTLPVLTGYVVLGFGFGIILNANGYSIALAVAMSTFIYAGSMQYAAIGLLTGGASLLTTALTTLMVNARHLFYGISMLDKYRNTGKRKPYLIFALTEETYSLVCTDHPGIPESQREDYWFFVSLFDHLYWIAGSALGAVAGFILPINSEGLDFALTALFVTVFTEQWLTSKDHRPAITGVAVSAVCLAVFGPDAFLIPAMVCIAAILCIPGKETRHD